MVETAKMGEPWQADWITPDWDDNQVHPILYRQFELPARPVRARAYICGLGLYHFALNGEKVGNEHLTPYCNAYDQWIQYQTFDITGQLAPGANVACVMLGNGWYKGRYGRTAGASFYGDRFALICELHITLENGDTAIIASDRTWKAQPAPVLRERHLRRGDVRRPHQGRAAPEHSSGVRLIDLDKSRLEARRSLPVCVNETIKPVAVLHTPAGETVLDMGQNITGWVSLSWTNAP